MVSWRFLSCVVGVALFCGAVDRAYAQNTSLFGSSSVSNRSASLGMGSGLGGSLGGFGSFGSSGPGGLSGGGFGSFGSSMGLGGQGFGGARTGTGFGNQNLGLGGTTQGGFVGRNTNGNQFVGMNPNTGGNQGQLGGGNRNANLNRQNLAGGLGGRNLLQNSQQNLTPNLNQGNAASSQVLMLRAPQRVAFEFPKPPPRSLTTSVQSRFSKLTAGNAALKNVTLTVDEDGLVRLQGEVDTPAAERLAERLVRLEPGVRGVRSELTIREPSRAD